MNAFSDYYVRITGNDYEKEAISQVISDVVFEGYDVITNDDGDIIVEQDYGTVWIEELTTLAINMAKVASDSSFFMKGYICIENSGESMDFAITYKEHKVTVMSSDWYHDYYIDDNEISYEEFCEEYCFDEEWSSEEEFETAKNEGSKTIFACSGKLVPEIELSDITTINI